MTLLITGAVQYSRTVSADADGFVRFEVPLVETNSVVTVELSVQDSNGTVIFTGSNTQKVDGTGNLEVKLMRQFWTLPASLLVAVSPSAIAYNPTAPASTSVDFSITNLTGAPDGAALAYSWKDATGAEVGTGAILTRTALDMLGAGFSPMNDSETRTYTVEVTYTDATGSTVTSSGSATATIATSATLVVEAAGATVQPGAADDRLVLVVNKGTSVSFTASILCYGGTPTYEWASSGTALGSTLTGSDTSVTSTKSANADAGGLSTVTVTAALADGRELTKYIDVYVLDLTMSEGGSLLTSSDAVVLIDQAGDTASLTASLAGLDGLSGVSYSWQVMNTACATVSPAGSTPSATATVTSAATGTTSVQVTASYKGVTTTPVSHPLYVVGLTVSSGGTALTGDLAMAKDAAAKTLTAAVVNSGSITVSPSNYNWEVTGSSVTASGSNASRSLTPAAGGKSTVTVSANVGSRTLTKTVDVYVFDIALSASATLTPSTEFVDAWYPAPDITMATEDTAGVGITASLNGTDMPEVEYEWQTSGADLPIELTGTGASCTVRPRATGMTTVKVRVKYGGANVAYRNIHITVAGLAISGSATHVWNAAAASHTMSLTVAPVGLPDGASVTYETTLYSSSNTDVATIAVTGGGTGITVTAKKGGLATITAQATYGSKTLTASKEIAILKLNVTDAAGDPVPATGNEIGTGEMTQLTAALEDIPTADVSYAWTTSASTKISLSPMDEASTTLTGVALGDANISVTATYKSTTTCNSPAMAFSVGLTIAGLSEYFATLNPADYDIDHPLVLPAIVGLTKDNWTGIRSALRTSPGSSFYVDLSQTRLPSDITSLSSGFYQCAKMVKAPQLPASMPGEDNDMDSCFEGCSSLTTAPALPAGITYMNGCFEDCTNLSDISAILTLPTTVTEMGRCFQNCTSLPADLSSMVLPPGVTDVSYCFAVCDTITNAPEIPDSVHSMARCFSGCTSLGGTVTIRADTFISTDWYPDVFYHCVEANFDHIYVPASMVNSFKSKWSNVAGKIEPLP